MKSIRTIKNNRPRWYPLGVFYFDLIRPIKWIVLFIYFFGYQANLSGQGKLVMTQALEEAYRDISSLRIQEGRNKLQQSNFVGQQNMMGYYIENYIDFFTLFIQEDQTLYKKLLPNRNIRLQIIKSADSNTPYYLFCQAEIILQWATIKLKFNEKMSAGRDIYEAYNLLTQNQKKYPNFILNNKSLSIIHALTENIPSWVRKLLDIQGSIQMGTQEIKTLAKYVSDQNHMYKNEVIAIYSYILFFSNNERETAYALYDNYHLDHRTNPLIAFLKATMAQKTGRNDLAIKILEERPQTDAYLRFDYLQFLYGKFKLYRLDQDADVYLLKFVNNFKGKQYLKEAYQKLAWYSLIISNDKNNYNIYMNQCLKIGNTLIDEDKQAYNEAKSKETPDPVLLRSRLLFDGGYFKSADDLLTSKVKLYTNHPDEGEYYYRLARIKDALHDDVDAIRYYNLAISKSKSDKYYGCSAALNSGFIYEKNKQYKEANTSFNKCLMLNPEGYGNSLHQKAKLGLERVKGRF